MSINWTSFDSIMGIGSACLLIPSINTRAFFYYINYSSWSSSRRRNPLFYKHVSLLWCLFLKLHLTTQNQIHSKLCDITLVATKMHVILRNHLVLA